MTDLLLSVGLVLFPVSEIALALLKRSRTRVAQGHDRGSMRLLWISIVVGLVLANAIQWLPGGSLPISLQASRILALGLLAFGLAVRWTAILTLGRFFTVDVAIHSDHEVVQTGLYRFVRHPSYTGLLIAFVGLAATSGNWLSILGLLVPVTFGVVNRVTKEEQALLRSLGPQYAAYCARTKRFVPGLL